MSRGREKQTTLDLARDELFSHIQRCGVLDAEDTERKEWMSDTVEYLRERYPALSDVEVSELEAIGIDTVSRRFRLVRPRGMPLRPPTEERRGRHNLTLPLQRPALVYPSGAAVRFRARPDSTPGGLERAPRNGPPTPMVST